ncbi:MAG: thiamine phosphate synthase [Clostridia bacterium]|nr:thiamine phosphate synthase [Clostridia bacterium]
MFTSDPPAVVFVTEFSLCPEPPLKRLEKFASSGADCVILRAKGLSYPEYLALAKEALAIFSGSPSRLVLHGSPEAADELGYPYIHLPLGVLRTLDPEKRKSYKTLGASCHSADDAAEAEKAGCTYISAGHVFDTDCKKGLPGRGTDFLREVCAAVRIPVLAIGGVAPQNARSLYECGASGFCVMSSAMTCADPKALVKEFKNA